MKKILSIIIAVVLMMTAGSGAVFANQGNKKLINEGNVAVSKVSKEIEDGYQKQLNLLKNKYKKGYNNKNTQTQLLNDIAKLKKKYGDKTIAVFVNGQEITTIEAPVIKSGKLLLPIKALTKGLKAQYTYDKKTGVIIITKGDVKVTLTIGSNIAVVNNAKLNLEYKVEMDKKKGIMIPLGLLSRLLNGKAVYDKDSGTVTAEDGIVHINDNTTGAAIEQFNYAGIWSYGEQSGAFRNDNHWSSTTGSSLTVKFSGTKIKLYGAKAPNHGIAYISINGTTASAIDFYSETRKDNVLIYESPTLGTDREHELAVIVSGLKNTSSSGIAIAADRVEVTRVSTANLALNKTTTASSIFSDGVTTHSAIHAVDGKAETRWSSVFSDQQWIVVDLENIFDVAKVKLKWETAFGKSYIIQLSTDGTNWGNAATVTNGDGGTDEVVFTGTKARYVRMLGVQRATTYGYSLYEFEVYSK